MQTNNHSINDYDVVLDAKFGKKGTRKRAKAEEDAYAFYSGQIIQNARKSIKMTQETLAQKIGANKGYISRIENGLTVPNVGTFYRIISALGMKVEIVKSSEKG